MDLFAFDPQVPHCYWWWRMLSCIHSRKRWRGNTQIYQETRGSW